MPDTKTGHIHWGPWDFDYDVWGFEALCLLNGTFRGRKAFGKFSMPAIRVKYLCDGGFLDWKRQFGLGAGPYADRIFWKPADKKDYGLQRISNRGNQYVGFADSIVKGVKWMELCIYARIGAYHLAQQWHLSEDGWIAPRIWSKGLTINMDHWHHPYWRFDFDIDGTEPNRVWRFDVGKASSFYPREANDIKETTITLTQPANPECDRIRERVGDLKDQIQDATGSQLHGLAAQLKHAQDELDRCEGRAVTVTQWYVRNEKTGAVAWVIPSENDGWADSFSSLDVGIRRFHRDEEATPWVYKKGWSPRFPLGTWNFQDDTGELGFLNGEDVSSTDIVFWYVSHMSHHAKEGADHWHWSGPWIKFNFDEPPPPPRHDFGMMVDIKRNLNANETIVRGRGFTPGGSVVVTFDGIPHREQMKRYLTADRSSKFTLTESFRFTSDNRDDAFGKVEICCFDVTTGLMDKQTVSAAYWVA